MHMLDESFNIEDEDNENSALNDIYHAYGRTGIFLASKFKWDQPFEKKIIDEFFCEPDKTVDVLNNCQEFVWNEPIMLNKIIIDLCIEYFRSFGNYQRLIE